MFELNSSAIRARLVEKQLTIRDLAKSAGLTETTAQKVVRSDARANARTTGKLATALDIPAKAIIKE